MTDVSNVQLSDTTLSTGRHIVLQSCALFDILFANSGWNITSLHLPLVTFASQTRKQASRQAKPEKMRLSTTTTRTKILALPLLLLLLLVVAVAVTNATPLPPSPSPPPSDFSEIEARWAVGQTEVSTSLLHVTCSSFYTTTTENKNDKSSREIYTYTHIFTALPPSPSFHHPHINQPTHLP